MCKRVRSTNCGKGTRLMYVAVPKLGLPSHNRHPGPARCWASPSVKRDSRTSLYLRLVSVAGKWNSEAQRQLGRKCLLGIIGLCRDSNPSGGARQFGAIRQQPGNLR